MACFLCFLCTIDLQLHHTQSSINGYTGSRFEIRSAPRSKIITHSDTLFCEQAKHLRIGSLWRRCAIATSINSYQISVLQTTIEHRQWNWHDVIVIIDIHKSNYGSPRIQLWNFIFELYLSQIMRFMSGSLILLTGHYGWDSWDSMANIDINPSSMSPIFGVWIGPTLGVPKWTIRHLAAAIW